MSRILITTDVGARNILHRWDAGQPIAEVVTVSDVDGIYAIRCTGDGIDQCPGDIEPGDTWSNFENCVMEAIRHIENHEDRS